MNKFQVVSMDMFGTLANIDSVGDDVWKIFLKERYNPEFASECWTQATAIFFRIYEKILHDRAYIPPRAIYQRLYMELFPELELDLDPAEASDILAMHHSMSQPFPDTIPFLEAAGKKYTVCVSSDTDNDMLGPLKELYPFDFIFTSESLGCYKTGEDGRFFSEVIKHYGVEPEQIIHIGDSFSDIAGAKEAGVIACWLNRKNRGWEHDIKPDFEVKSLIEAASVIGVNIDLGWGFKK